jgi:transcriptional regulator of acetoin/glycerol metabolism
MAERRRLEPRRRVASEEALPQARGNHSEAARRLGLTRVTLLDEIKRHGLSK